MAAGDPWWAAKYSHGVWEHFPDQENPFLKNHFFVNFGTPPGDGGGDDGGGTLPAGPAPSQHAQGPNIP